MLHPVQKRERSPEAECQECSICFEVIDQNASIQVLDCHHTFHAPCIKQWLLRNPTCPLCRHDVDNKELNDVLKERRISINNRSRSTSNDTNHRVIFSTSQKPDSSSTDQSLLPQLFENIRREARKKANRKLVREVFSTFNN